MENKRTIDMDKFNNLFNALDKEYDRYNDMITKVLRDNKGQQLDALYKHMNSVSSQLIALKAVKEMIE